MLKACGISISLEICGVLLNISKRYVGSHNSQINDNFSNFFSCLPIKLSVHASPHIKTTSFDSNSKYTDAIVVHNV